MRTQSPDTSPDAERVQIERLRAMTPAQRMTVSRAMTRRNIRLSCAPSAGHNPTRATMT